jgi:hypothetical protein
MADDHAEPANPNAAPIHLEVREDFPRAHIAFAVGVGLIAAVAGLVLGIVLTV